MRVLITGATGFLGQHIVERLYNDGHELKCIVRSAEKAQRLERFHPELVYGDLIDGAAVDETVNGVDAIVHAAAMLGGWGKKEQFVRNNLDATRRLADAALKAGVRRFVYVSSATSYGMQPNVRLTEDSPTYSEPDPYCETKLLCEELLNVHASRNELQVTILRPSIIYGPYDERFIPQVIFNIKRGRTVAIGEPGQGPPLVYVKDVAHFISAILGNQRTPFEIFNLSDPEIVSWERIMGDVATVLNIPARVRRIPFSVAYTVGGIFEFLWRIARASHPPILTRFIASLVGLQYNFDSSKALSLSGFAGFTPFSVGLMETMEWFEKKSEKIIAFATEETV